PRGDQASLGLQLLEVAVMLGDDPRLLLRRLERRLLAHRPEDDEPAHAGKTTSARAPAKEKLPCSSSATSARTIERPVPVGAPSTPDPSSAIATITSPFRRASSIRTVPAPS